MNTIRVAIAIQSHLSDACLEMSEFPQMSRDRIQFVKRLVMMYPDTKTEVSIDHLNELFNKYVLKQEA